MEIFKYRDNIILKLNSLFKSILICLLLTSIVWAGGDHKKTLPKLPSGPDIPVPFGAYYTKLKYTPKWDKQWPVSHIADIVVRFGGKNPRFVFWRGTSYIPCWATNDGPWFTNEYFERRGGQASGTTSMVEPMSDKQCRYSFVNVIENDSARVIIHWRYAPVDLDYELAYVNKETNWGDWADEYYILYPDAVGIREATLHTSALNDWIEYQESIVINQPGTSPDENINHSAITLLNLAGVSKTYTWTKNGSPGLKNPPEDFCIQRVNFKSEYKPFSIVNPHNVKIESYGGHAPDSYFNCWNHWPVSQAKSDTRVAKSFNKPSHTSLSNIKWLPYSKSKDSITWIMMHGMIKSGEKKLVLLARSWIHPAKLSLTVNKFRNDGYDPAQRAYVITSSDGNQPSVLKFKLNADENSPVVNPAFLIKNWGNANVSLKINDRLIKPGEDFRTGHITKLIGTDLIVWLKLSSDKPVDISLMPVE